MWGSDFTNGVIFMVWVAGILCGLKIDKQWEWGVIALFSLGFAFALFSNKGVYDCELCKLSKGKHECQAIDIVESKQSTVGDTPDTLAQKIKDVADVYPSCPTWKNNYISAALISLLSVYAVGVGKMSTKDLLSVFVVSFLVLELTGGLMRFGYDVQVWGLVNKNATDIQSKIITDQTISLGGAYSKSQKEHPNPPIRWQQPYEPSSNNAAPQGATENFSRPPTFGLQQTLPTLAIRMNRGSRPSEFGEGFIAPPPQGYSVPQQSYKMNQRPNLVAGPANVMDVRHSMGPSERIPNNVTII